MAGKLYKYNDSWVSYGYLHDTFGYTDAPSFDISYKSTNPWGEMDTTGYMSATDFYDIRTYELWKQGAVGWYSMNEMAVQGSYPDTATETMMRNGNITSNAAYITDPNGVDYYIVQAAISEGWLTLDEWALLGWEPGGAVESPLCGSMGADYSESVMGYPAERMERGGIGFTGLLRENFIPASGVVEGYIERFDTVTDSIYRMGLPNDHSGSYIKTSMDSLRYYAKGTLSNTGVTTATYFGQYGEWYHGTITWTDETLGDLTDKITVTPLTSSDLEHQTIFRIIFISDGEISGFHPSDTAENNRSQITNYNYNNGTHSIEFYSDSGWTFGIYAGRIQFRYLDGVTEFENLSTFDLVNISSGTLSKATSTDRFNMYNIWNGDVTIKAYY